MAKRKKLTFEEQLYQLGACYEARQWVGNRTLAQAWKYRQREILGPGYNYTPQCRQHLYWKYWLVNRLYGLGELRGMKCSSTLAYVTKVRVSTIQRALDRVFAGYDV